MADDTAEARRARKAEQERRWRQANRDRINENRRRRREANREAEKEKAHQYYLTNRDRILETNRRWVSANPEKANEIRRNWRAANRDRLLEERRQYRAANREKLNEQARALSRKNRERTRDQWTEKRMRFVHGRDWGTWYEATWTTQDGKCYLCGDPLDPDAYKAIVIDHDHRCCPPAKSCTVCRRGLACTLCNKLIGLAHDDVARLRRIADGLEAALGAFEERFVSTPQQETMF